MGSLTLAGGGERFYCDHLPPAPVKGEWRRGQESTAWCSMYHGEVVSCT